MVRVTEVFPLRVLKDRRDSISNGLLSSSEEIAKLEADVRVLEEGRLISLRYLSELDVAIAALEKIDGATTTDEDAGPV